MSGSPAPERSADKVFAEIVLSPAISWRVTELAGRGIAAYARCLLASLQDKMLVRPARMPANQALAEALESADHLIELANTEDELEELWERRQAQAIDSVEFEAVLSQIVERLESWPARRPHIAKA